MLKSYTRGRFCMIIAANWKMNPLPSDALALFDSYCSDQRITQAKSEVICFVPSCYFGLAEQSFSSYAVEWGAQNSFPKPSGAFTGELSADMISGIGGKWVLAGHSERRTLFGETDAFVAQKLLAGLKAGLRVILCIGEELQQRQTGLQNACVRDQLLSGLAAFCGEPTEWQDKYLRQLVIAYEPVWAIGTGLVAEKSQIEVMHSHIHAILREQFSSLSARDMPSVLYGGSVKEDNAASIFSLPEVGGALIGGASLSADSFAAIVSYADKAI